MNPQGGHAQDLPRSKFVLCVRGAGHEDDETCLHAAASVECALFRRLFSMYRERMKRTAYALATGELLASCRRAMQRYNAQTMHRARDAHAQTMHYIAYRAALYVSYETQACMDFELHLLNYLMRKCPSMLVPFARPEIAAIFVSVCQAFTSSTVAPLTLHIMRRGLHSVPMADTFAFKLCALRAVALVGVDRDECLLQDTLHALHASRLLADVYDRAAGTYAVPDTGHGVLEDVERMYGRGGASALKYECTTGVPMYVSCCGQNLGSTCTDGLTPMQWHVVISRYGIVTAWEWCRALQPQNHGRVVGSGVPGVQARQHACRKGSNDAHGSGSGFSVAEQSKASESPFSVLE